MSPSRPFVDPATGELDTGQILAEAVPLAKLIGAFALLALVPLVVVLLLGPHSQLAVVFTILAQFVLAIGAGITLLYVVVRGIHLAAE